MDRITPEEQLAGIAALADPVRRALYLYVASHQEAVGRDQAAEGLGIARSLAAFHLDRLVAEGLLEADYRRLSGRRGPGAGRPAKVYRRSSREVQVSLPPRNYELAARMLVRAVEALQDGADRGTASEAARSFGRDLAREARHPAGADPAATLVDVLEAHGFEPHRAPGGEIRLGNCPFHALSREHRELVCGMNLEAMRGVLEGLGEPDLHAEPDPEPGACCVRFRAGEPDRAAL